MRGVSEDNGVWVDEIGRKGSKMTMFASGKQTKWQLNSEENKMCSW